MASLVYITWEEILLQRYVHILLQECSGNVVTPYALGAFVYATRNIHQ